MKKNRIVNRTLNGRSPNRSGKRKYISRTLVAAVSCMLSLATFQSALANVNLASVPVFLKESVDPNLVFVFDDSGSMGWRYMPSDLGGNDWYSNHYYSSHVNKIYYDPSVTYEPPYMPDGTSRYPDSSYTDAWVNGFDQSDGTDNLSNDIRFDQIGSIEEGFYMQFNSSTSCDGNPKQDDCYTTVLLNNASDGVKQNYANWFSYYSRRDLASKSGITEAFFDLPENIRLGYGAININNTTIDGENTDTLASGVRAYDSTRRQQFLTWLHNKNVSGGTPLRTALKDVGDYFSRADNRGPWGNDPGTNDTSSQVECRQSYTILMTDGIWNGNSSPQVGNVDGASGPSHTNPKPEGDDFNYQAVSPFADDHSNTLADVAMQYWKTDLRPTLADKVPTAGIDDAFWQHMTTFTVGLGVEGTVSESDAFAAIASGNQINWPEPFSGAGAPNIDDLLHAAVNGRGGFASAQNPEEFSREMKGFLDTVVARAETSASSAAVSAAVLRTDTLGFFAGFRSDDWSGTLSAFNFESGESIWDAEETLRNKSPSERNIFTHDGTSAVSLLDITKLSTNQQDALNADPDNPGSDDNLGQDRIDWIRGETGAASFRSRDFTPEGGGAPVTRLLGDIVNASPLFVGTPNYGFRRLNGNEGSSYSIFRSSEDYRDRTTAVYAASNNGLLHAFDSSEGDELFAYMPGELLEAGQNASSARISTLISPDYAHRYFMDGSPTALDAYIEVDGTSQWRTVLTGSMGAGGRTVFALDITDPDEFSADSVLWEFSHPDLGQGVTDVRVARLENGTWAAIFGNGYNGDDEKASLFVVDLADGSLIRQIETGAGGTANSNGLSTPVVTTFPETDGITRYAYAGDMLGNMWRFDLTGGDDDGSQWATTKLFSAVGPGGNAQPITAAPAVTVNPSDLDELILSFGTGSLIRNGDDAFDEIQSFYSIRDDLTQSSLNRSDDLLEQTITSQSSVQTPRADGTGTNTAVLRDTSNNELTDEQGWYLDLSVGGSKDGERVISQPTFPFGLTPDRVRFSTVIPDADPCSPGRTGFIMDLDIVSGGPPAPDSPVFDLNGDGLFNTADIPGSGDDSDGDGVADTFDQCVGTSTGVSVDSYGCGSGGDAGDGGDGDGDGVPNIDDQCAGTSTGVSVDSYGCGPGNNYENLLAPSGIQSGDGTRITTIADPSGQLEMIVDDPTQTDPDDPCVTAICVFTGGDLGRQTWEQLR